jgi:hypothetical protein
VDVDRFPAHIRKMKKRIGWKLSRSITGTYEVAEVLEGGTIGSDIIDFTSKEDAEKFIDSDDDRPAALGARLQRGKTP